MYWYQVKGPMGTRYPKFILIPDPTQFSFENHRILGNLKYWLLSDIAGIPCIWGLPQISSLPYIDTQNTLYAWKCQRVKKVSRNTHSNISTLLSDPSPPATWLFFSIPYPNLPDIEKKNPTRRALMTALPIWRSASKKLRKMLSPNTLSADLAPPGTPQYRNRRQR